MPWKIVLRELQVDPAAPAAKVSDGLGRLDLLWEKRFVDSRSLKGSS